MPRPKALVAAGWLQGACAPPPMPSILYSAELLHVNRLHHFLAVCDRGFLESLTAAEFLYDTGFFKLALEFLEGSFDLFAFFYLYDNHIIS